MYKQMPHGLTFRRAKRAGGRGDFLHFVQQAIRW